MLPVDPTQHAKVKAPKNSLGEILHVPHIEERQEKQS